MSCTWSGGLALPAPCPALAHRTRPRQSSPYSHTRSCTWPRWGACSGWGPRPRLGTLLPPERQSDGLGQRARLCCLAWDPPRSQKPLRPGQPRTLVVLLWGPGRGVAGCTSFCGDVSMHRTKGPPNGTPLGKEAGAPQGTGGPARRVPQAPQASSGPRAQICLPGPLTWRGSAQSPRACPGCPHALAPEPPSQPCFVRT